MKLLYYPSDSLTTKCEPYINFGSEAELLVEQMTNIMITNNGIGLAANQVGLPFSLFIIKDRRGNIYSFFNPKILETIGEVVMNEGCLSFPNIYLNIKRPEYVLLEYQDVNGEIKKIMAEGIEARVILHEYEHILGSSFLMKVNRQQRKIAIAQMKKL